MRRLFILPTVLLLLAPALSGCSGIPKDALRMNKATLKERQLQTRVFATMDEARILAASAALLQDLGFNLDESETDLGLIVVSKERDAMEAGQVIAALTMAALFGVNTPIDKEQKIRACVVTCPSGEKGEKIAVRVTFQRIVWDTYGNVSMLEKLTDPKLYQEFFSKLSKAVFLEAHGV